MILTASVGSEWKRWFRSIQLYADGKGLIIEPEKDDNKVQRRALLLYCAGSDVQDIFDVLPVTGNAKDYEMAEEALTRYFVTQVNFPYERHRFREMVQNEHETIDQFVVRLRRKAQQCDYGNQLKSQIIDQVISKCRSSDLRRKFLDKGHTLNLKQLQEIARTSAAVKRQAKSMCGPGDGVNRVSERPNRQTRHERKSEKPGIMNKTGECFRYGKPGHFTRDPKCPARGKECSKCQQKGHFAVMCKTKSKEYVKPRVSFVDEEDEYAFTVKGTLETGVGNFL